MCGNELINANVLLTPSWFMNSLTKFKTKKEGKFMNFRNAKWRNKCLFSSFKFPIHWSMLCSDNSQPILNNTLGNVSSYVRFHCWIPIRWKRKYWLVPILNSFPRKQLFTLIWTWRKQDFLCKKSWEQFWDILILTYTSDIWKYLSLM